MVRWITKLAKCLTSWNTRFWHVSRIPCLRTEPKLLLDTQKHVRIENIINYRIYYWPSLQTWAGDWNVLSLCSFRLEENNMEENTAFTNNFHFLFNSKQVASFDAHNCPWTPNGTMSRLCRRHTKCTVESPLYWMGFGFRKLLQTHRLSCYFGVIP